MAVRVELERPRRARRVAIAAGLAAIVAIVATAAALATRGDDAPPPPRAVAQRRLTTTAAAPATQPTSVALSLDGATLAYTVGIELTIRSIPGSGDTGDGVRAIEAVMPTNSGGLSIARLVEAAGFLADGRVVARILDPDHAWGVWAIAADRPPERLYEHAERMAIAVAPRGDQLAIATPSAGLVAVPIGGGAPRALIAARAGERLTGLAWSPDGARIAFVRHTAAVEAASLEIVDVASPMSSRRVARPTLVDPVDQMTAWLTDDRILYVANDPVQGAALMAIALAPPESSASPAGGGAKSIIHWPGEHVAQLASGRGRLAVLRGTAEHTILLGTDDRRGYLLNLERAVPEQAAARALAGWTPDGRLVHEAGREVVARAPRGPATVLAGGIPDAVIGDAALYHVETPSRTLALHRVGLADRSDRVLAEVPFARGEVVRCAGDRAPPCVLAEAGDGAVRYVRFDPASGARGEVLHRASLDRPAHSMALSPDGSTLAVADGSSTVTLVSGSRVTRESLAPSAQAIAVSWSRDGANLLVALLDGGDDRASVIRLIPGGTRQLLLHSNHRRYGRVHEVPVGNVVALSVRELALDAWLIDGL